MHPIKPPFFFKQMFILLLIACCYKLSYGQSAKTYINPRAVELMPTLVGETDRLFPEMIHYEFVPALIEQESCISVTHSKCFNPKAELKNSREHGAGLGMVTRAWTADGKLRFDTLESLRTQYKEELRELSWLNIKERPDLQIRAILLLARSSYRNYLDVQDTYERLKFVDSAYNGGDKDVKTARSRCKLLKGCDHHLWFNNVEKQSPKSTKPHAMYGGRSNLDINNEHVRNVFTIRIMKYKTYLDTHFPKIEPTPEPEPVVEPTPPVETKAVKEVGCLN